MSWNVVMSYCKFLLFQIMIIFFRGIVSRLNASVVIKWILQAGKMASM